MSSDDSVSKLLQLWMIVTESQQGNRDSLEWRSLQEILVSSSLGHDDMHEILDRDFGAGTGRPNANFMRFWQGMDVILHRNGSWDEESLDVQVQQLVASLRAFRIAVLQSLPGQYRGMPEITFDKLHRLYDRMRQDAVSNGGLGGLRHIAAYWEEKLSRLPDGDGQVTEDEISGALHKWLQEVVGGPGDVGDVGAYGADYDPGSPGSEDETTALGDQQSFATSSTGLSVRGASKLGSQGDDARSWLVDCEPHEPHDVVRFRQHLLNSLAQSGPDLRFGQLYRAVQDALDESPSVEERRAALRASLGLLGGVVSKQVRMAFRQWDARVPRSEARALPAMRSRGRPLRPEGDGGTEAGAIIAGMICSQAEAAMHLERRCSAIPWAYRLVCLLARARRRSLHGALERWQLQEGPFFPSRPPGGGEPLPPPPGGSPMPLQRSPSPRSAPSPGGSAPRRWGAAGRSPSTSQPAGPPAETPLPVRLGSSSASATRLRAPSGGATRGAPRM